MRRDRLRPHEVEAAIADLPVERLYLFDRGGRQVAVFEGIDEAVRYDLKEKERRRLSGGLAIHNHPPNPEYAPGDVRYDTDSFSIWDWQTMIDLDLGRAVVVSPFWRYSLIRPQHGWLAKHRDDWHVIEMLVSMSDRVAEDFDQAVATGTMTEIEAQVAQSHETNRRFAEEIGATYGRERR